MLQRITPHFISFNRAPLINQSLSNAWFLSCPLAIQQSRGAFSAWKKAENPSLLEKVTGWEENPDHRKAITNQFKALGLKWDHPGKAWVPSKDTNYDAIRGIIQAQPAIASTVDGDQKNDNSSYAKRIDTILKKWENELSNLLPRGVNKLNFFQSLRSALLTSAKSGSSSSDEALFVACTRCAQLGLVPGPLNEGYFSTRDEQIEFLIGYKGIISLARRAVPGLQIEANIVRNGDRFSYKLGTNPSVTLEHAEEVDPDDILYAYVLVSFPDGISKLSIIDQPHVQKRMACSRGANAPSSPWKKFKREMWLKTAIREAFRFVNLSPENQIHNDAEAAIKTLKDAISSLQSELDDIQGGKSGE